MGLDRAGPPDPELGLHAGVAVARDVAVDRVVARRQVDGPAVGVDVADLQLEAVDVAAVGGLDDERVGQRPSCTYWTSAGPAAIR